jgi:hypothetical protein
MSFMNSLTLIIKFLIIIFISPFSLFLTQFISYFYTYQYLQLPITHLFLFLISQLHFLYLLSSSYNHISLFHSFSKYLKFILVLLLTYLFLYSLQLIHWLILGYHLTSIMIYLSYSHLIKIHYLLSHLTLLIHYCCSFRT